MVHAPGSSSAPSRRSPRPRSGRAVLVAFAACGVLAIGGAGCGSSEDDDPFSEFEGRWIVDVDNSTLTCSQTMSVGTLSFSPWSNKAQAAGMTLGTISLEAGVLTDLVETSGQCEFGFNVKDKVATAPSVDPFTMQAPLCVVPVNGDGSTISLASNTMQPLTFQLDKPVPKMAQAAYLSGAADATVILADANTGQLQKLPPCTFAATLKLHKYAKP